MTTLRLTNKQGTELVLCRPLLPQQQFMIQVPEDTHAIISLDQARVLRDHLDRAIVDMENRPCPAQQPLFPGLGLAEARSER